MQRRHLRHPGLSRTPCFCSSALLGGCSGAICSVFAFHLTPVAMSVAEFNLTANDTVNATGYPFSSSTTGSQPTLLMGHNFTIQPKSKVCHDVSSLILIG
jgi:hypothetical protein